MGGVPEPLVRPPPGRVSNLMLLVALALAFATGTLAVATGSAAGRWVVIAHGVVAMAVVLLMPWKSAVVRRGLRKKRPGRPASTVLAVLTVATVLVGIAYSTGLVRSVGGVLGMWLHIAGALTIVPLVLWHVAGRGYRLRPSDRSRRTLLRAAVVGGSAVAVYGATEAAVRLGGLPGERRRFTGSYELASFRPADMPNTIWLDDSTPRLDAAARAAWRLTVVDGAGRRELTLADLAAHRVTVRATLDCTSGWFSHQDWTGVPLSALLDRTGEARSVLVRSTTGYAVRFPVRDLDRLLLATEVGGAPLSPGHGFPARLVAPDRRGFWWVKWVDRIELGGTPAWLQPPFPLS